MLNTDSHQQHGVSKISHPGTWTLTFNLQSCVFYMDTRQCNNQYFACCKTKDKIHKSKLTILFTATTEKSSRWYCVMYTYVPNICSIVQCKQNLISTPDCTWNNLTLLSLVLWYSFKYMQNFKKIKKQSSSWQGSAMGRTRLKTESWKVRNGTQNTSHQNHFSSFLKDISFSVLKSSYSLKSTTHDFQQQCITIQCCTFFLALH